MLFSLFSRAAKPNTLFLALQSFFKSAVGEKFAKKSRFFQKKITIFYEKITIFQTIFQAAPPFFWGGCRDSAPICGLCDALEGDQKYEKILKTFFENINLFIFRTNRERHDHWKMSKTRYFRRQGITGEKNRTPKKNRTPQPTSGTPPPGLWHPQEIFLYIFYYYFFPKTFVFSAFFAVWPCSEAKYSVFGLAELF